MSLRNNRGFTLIEVLVAVIILATGLVLVIEGMGRTQQAIGISQNLIRATLTAEKQMNLSGIELIHRHQLRTGSDAGIERIDGRNFIWQKEISPYTDRAVQDETKLNQVEVVVRWKESGRGENELKVASLYLNRNKEQ